MKNYIPEFYLIGLIKGSVKTKDDNKIIGFRLLDLGKNEIADVTVDSVLKKLFKNAIEVKNLKYYSEIFDYEEDYDIYKSDLLSRLDYNFIHIDNAESDYDRQAILFDNDGIIWVRTDGVYGYATNESFKEGYNTRSINGVYYSGYKEELNISYNILVNIEDSIYKDKLIRLKENHLNIQKKIDLFKVAGKYNELSLNELGEAKINEGEISHLAKSGKRISIELPKGFDRILYNNRCYLYGRDLELKFNKHLKILGDKVFNSASNLKISNCWDCWVEEIGNEAFKDVAINSLDTKMVFNVPCNIKSMAFFKTSIEGFDAIYINVAKIETFAFCKSYMSCKYVELKGGLQEFGVIEKHSFKDLPSGGMDIWLGNNLELDTEIFRGSHIKQLYINSNNIKVKDDASPFKYCEVEKVVFGPDCNRIPDGIFRNAKIKDIEFREGLSIGKKSFENCEFTQDINRGIFDIEDLMLGYIDDEAFRGCNINLDTGKIFCKRLGNRVFNESKINFRHTFDIRCNDIGEGLFYNATLNIGMLELNKPFNSMFESANLVYDDNYIENSIKFRDKFDIIPDRAFKNCIINCAMQVGITSMITGSNFKYIGVEAFKGCTYKYNQNWGISLNITSEIIKRSAFENFKAINNITQIDIEAYSIEERAFYGIELIKTFVQDRELKIKAHQIKKEAFNEMYDFSYIGIDQYSEDIMDIDSNNFKSKFKLVEVSVVSWRDITEENRMIIQDLN